MTIRKLKQFGNIKKPEIMFRKAIASREPVEIEALGDITKPYILDEPIEFDEVLLLRGQCGRLQANVPITMIRGTANLGDRPMFARNGFWVDSKNVWRGSDGVELPDAVTQTAGCGMGVELDRIYFQSLSPTGCCVQVFNSIQSSITNCNFGFAHRGLLCTGVFGGKVDNCHFYGELNARDWNQVVESWGLYVGGNMSVTNCRASGCNTGIVLNNAGISCVQTAIEVCFLGMKCGAQNYDTMVRDDRWLSGSRIDVLNLESCLRGISLFFGPGTELSNALVTGVAAPQFDGTRGACEFGVSRRFIHPDASIRNLAISGDFTVGKEEN